MEPLEIILKKIEDLERDLSAEIVVQEESGHWEWRTDLKGPKYDEDFYEGEVWIIDRPRITEPDTQRRETAKAELQKIRESSEWIAARYEARATLSGWGYVRIDDEVDLWFDELRKRLTKNTTVGEGYNVEEDLRTLYENTTPANHKLRRKAGELLGIDEVDILGHELSVYLGSSNLFTREQINMIYKSAKDVEHRRLASRLLGINSGDFLAYELHRGEKLNEDQQREVYKFATNAQDRILAGNLLGYSKARIWLHEKLLWVKQCLSE
ncbi:MAG: hypothetical protein AB1422_17870 [bacterium]